MTVSIPEDKRRTNSELTKDEVKQPVDFVMILRKIDRMKKTKESQYITEQNESKEHVL
jgi:hypothetical protein